MRIFCSEFQNKYETYTFAYCVYCWKDEQCELPKIYAQGFLPYTGDYKLEKDIFYLARSIRVDLARFSDTSENRRVDRKLDALNIELSLFSKENFNINDNQFRIFCAQYAQERFKGGVMDDERLSYVLSRDTLSHIFVFKTSSAILGYVFAVIEGDTLHYWYSFYNTELLNNYPLGKWMMWKTIDWANDNGLRYVYLGTAYKPGALYKVRDHKGVEFYDGSGWNNDIKELQLRCELDENLSPRACDLFKKPLIAVAASEK